jgi:hypothetical protein
MTLNTPVHLAALQYAWVGVAVIGSASLDYQNAPSAGITAAFQTNNSPCPAFGSPAGTIYAPRILADICQ